MTGCVWSCGEESRSWCWYKTFWWTYSFNVITARLISATELGFLNETAWLFPWIIIKCNYRKWGRSVHQTPWNHLPTCILNTSWNPAKRGGESSRSRRWLQTHLTIAPPWRSTIRYSAPNITIIITRIMRNKKKNGKEKKKNGKNKKKSDHGAETARFNNLWKIAWTGRG